MSPPQLRLRYLRGVSAGLEVVVRGPRCSIGRGHDNDLVLDEDDNPSASGSHAELRLEGGVIEVIDLASRNGTFVNGARIDRAPLRAGDRLALGGEALFRVEGRRRPTRRALWLSAAALAMAAAALVVAWRAGLGRGRRDFAAAAARATPGLYLVARESDAGLIPIGTAFAVRSDGLLATNAHVALALGGVAGEASGIVVRSDSAGQRRRVGGVRVHPGYQAGRFDDDVALLRLTPGAPLVPLDLGSARIDRGVRLASLGFPAAVTDPERPRARLREHMVGDVRGRRYFEIGAGIAPGCSGGPVINSAGEVAGVVVGGELEHAATLGPSGWAIASSAVLELLALEDGAGR